MGARAPAGLPAPGGGAVPTAGRAPQGIRSVAIGTSTQNEMAKKGRQQKKGETNDDAGMDGACPFGEGTRQQLSGCEKAGGRRRAHGVPLEEAREGAGTGDDGALYFASLEAALRFCEHSLLVAAQREELCSLDKPRLTLAEILEMHMQHPQVGAPLQPCAGGAGAPRRLLLALWGGTA